MDESLQILVKYVHDPQLALFLSVLLEGEDSSSYRTVMDHLLTVAAHQNDTLLQATCYEAVNQPHQVIQCLFSLVNPVKIPVLLIWPLNTRSLQLRSRDIFLIITVAVPVSLLFHSILLLSKTAQLSFCFKQFARILVMLLFYLSLSSLLLHLLAVLLPYFSCREKWLRLSQSEIAWPLFCSRLLVIPLLSSLILFSVRYLLGESLI